MLAIIHMLGLSYVVLTGSCAYVLNTPSLPDNLEHDAAKVMLFVQYVALGAYLLCTVDALARRDRMRDAAILLGSVAIGFILIPIVAALYGGRNAFGVAMHVVGGFGAAGAWIYGIGRTMQRSIA